MPRIDMIIEKMINEITSIKREMDYKKTIDKLRDNDR